jgi:hypothetical protein
MIGAEAVICGANMKKNKENMIKIAFDLPRANPTDLRGKQSVRATFRLSEKAVDAISIVAVHLGIKQKSLFDHLMEDSQCLKLIANEIQSFDFKNQNRIQKTYVLSRKTLNIIEETSRTFNAPRDALVEFSIQRLLPIIAREQEKHARRKEMMNKWSALLNQGQKLLKQTHSLLGDNDPVFVKMEAALTAYENAFHFIEDYIEKGKKIEQFR